MVGALIVTISAFMDNTYTRFMYQHEAIASVHIWFSRELQAPSKVVQFQSKTEIADVTCGSGV